MITLNATNVLLLIGQRSMVRLSHSWDRANHNVSLTPSTEVRSAEVRLRTQSQFQQSQICMTGRAWELELWQL